MAAKIGVLGSTTLVTGGTHTVYTVPANRAAKIRLQWWVSAPNTCLITIRVAGQNVFQSTAVGDQYSASAGALATPATGVALLFQDDNPVAVVGATHIIRPLPVDYYLSATQTVTFTVGTVAATAVRLLVMGVEDDA